MSPKKKRGGKTLPPPTPDFQAVLALPERLAYYLRTWLQVTDADWALALDKLRQATAHGIDVAYRRAFIPQGPGRARRPIRVPCDELKMLQDAVLHRILEQVPIHFCRHGTPRGSSTRTNAAQHAGFAEELIETDLVRAFPTVFRSRVRANLEKPVQFLLQQFAGVTFSEDDVKQLLEALVDLVVLEDRLPQGAPTSPRLLAIVCWQVDQALWGLCEAASTPFQRYRLTAWLDNFYVSSNGKIPPEMAERIRERIRDHGFIPHTRPDKSRHYSPATGTQPVVTGLVIHKDGRLTMAPAKVNAIRGRLHVLLQQSEWDARTLGQAAGLLGYVRNVYPERVPSDLRPVVTAFETRIAHEKAARAAARAGLAPPPALDAPEAPETAPAPKRGRKGRKRPPKDLALGDVVEIELPLE